MARLTADPASVHEAAALAPAADARRPLALALVLARDLCGAALEIPASLASAVPAVAGAVNRVVAVVDGARPELPAHGPETRRFHLALLETSGARRRYRWRTLSDPMLPDVRAVRPPDALAFAYPAVRVARLGVRAVTGARGDDA